MGNKPSWKEVLKSADIDRKDIEGPKIDRRTSMKLFGVAGATGLASAMAGCLGDDDTEVDDTSDDAEADGDAEADDAGDEEGDVGDDPYGDTLTIGASIDELWDLDPHYLDRTDDAQISMNCINGMMRLNEDLELEGDVVEDWTLEDDTTIVFELKEGMQFHNGDPLDAEAVKYSIDRLRNLDDSGNQFKLDAVDEVTTNGDSEVTFHLSRPDAALLVNMEVQMGRAGGIVHELVEEDPDEFNETLSIDGESVSSGPYRIADRNFGQSVTLERVDTYWEEDDDGNQLPYFDEIVFDFIPEPSTMWSALEAGDIDTTTNITFEFADQATERDDIDAISAMAGEWKTVGHLATPPHEEPEWAIIAGDAESEDEVYDGWEEVDEIPTQDARVRRAVSKAIDREEVVERGYFGFARPAHGLFCPTLGRWYEEDPGPDRSGFYHDPEEAEELLDDAGYTGDPRFEVEITGRFEDERMLTVIEEQLNAVGIDATVDVQSDAGYWDDVYHYRPMMEIVGGAGELDPWTQWYRQFGTPDEETGRGTYQKGLWSNEDFDEAIENDWETMDPDEREQYIEEGLQIFYEEHPASLVAHPDKTKAKVPELVGMEWQNEYIDATRARFED